jgi:holliday junction DNA helicase RuvA
MIRTIKGEVSLIGDNYVVVEVGGLGYQVFITNNRLKPTPGDNIDLYTHLVVKENALDLYGFEQKIELDFFELLMTVPKIGPKSALQILNQAEVGLIGGAILEQDPERLHKLSGLTKKTATNLVNHLAGKIDHLAESLAHPLSETSRLSQAQLDAVDALITLGYDPKEAHDYVTKADQNSDTKSIIQSALKQMPIH